TSCRGTVTPCARRQRSTPSPPPASPSTVPARAGTATPARAIRDERHVSKEGSALEVLAVATRLGLTSFGGPVAHLGYFREEYVRRLKWLSEDAYADLVALCQFLPGPTSSQVGVAIGIVRAGLPGALAAWLG